MTRSRAILLGSLFGLTAAASGCAQLAGLTDDYHLASAGAAADAGSATGGSLGVGGQIGSGGHANETDAGAAGESEAEAGASANGGQSAAGGQGGSSGHPSVIGSGGTNNTAGSSHGGTGGSSTGAGGTSTGGTGGSSTGSGGLGGSGGAGTGVGPTRVGFSMFHDSAFGNDNASSHWADASFTKPAGTAAGDLILVFFGADHGLSNLDGTTLHGLGWELIDQHADLGTDGQGTYLLYRIATGTEPDPIVFKEINSPDSGNGVQGLLSVYRGVNKTTPINAYESNPVDMGSDGLSFVNNTPAITTTVSNCLLIAGLSPDTAVDRPVIDSWPDGFDDNKVSVVNAANPYPLGWANIFSAERHLATAGSVPASSFTWHVTNKTGGGTYYGYLTFVLALAPAN